MRGKVIFLILWIIGGFARDASAEWQQAFRTVVDTKIHSFQQDSVNSDRILIGIEGGILESKDRGNTWKRTLTVPSNQTVLILYQEPGLQRWWAATPRAIYRSADGGRKWEPAAQFLSNSGQINCILTDETGLYVGWSNGLTVSYDEGSTWSDVSEFSGRAVFQVSRSGDSGVWVAAEGGVYRSGPNRSWGQMYQRLSLNHSEAEEIVDGDSVDSDESESGPIHSVYFWFMPQGGVTVIDGTKKINIDLTTGRSEPAGVLPIPILFAPNNIGDKSGHTVLATERGVGLWVESSQAFQELPAGWPGSIARFLAYDSVEDELIAVTSRGVFKYEHPDLNSYLETRLQSNALKTEALLNQFAHEPQILELQEAAMRYAEVHPEKIIAWRLLAARRAWLPSLSVGHDVGLDQTVDIDRGGTGDTDRFIQGPNEEDQQWAVDVSWDLGDLVWTNDQTTIDNRSKLMAQLRDDLLTQLNSLYYSRRRLQVAGLVESGTGLQKDIDRRLQIDEYTAGIDALTGGYFSKKMSQTIHFEERPELL